MSRRSRRRRRGARVRPPLPRGLPGVDGRRRRYGVLHFAARNGRLGACRCLIEACGGACDPLADAEVTPFQLAAWQLQLEVLEYLAGAGADPARVNGFGCTSAHWVMLAPEARAADVAHHLRVAVWLEAKL